MIATRFGLALALLAAGCRRPSSSSVEQDAHAQPDAPVTIASVARDWGELPRTVEEVRALVARETRRPAAPDAIPTEREIGAALGGAGTIAGRAAIQRWIAARLARAGDNDAVLLFGTLHDSRGQIDAFRTFAFGLGSGGGAWPITHVVAEQLDARGGFRGVGAEMQRGESDALATYLHTGARDVLDSLATTQRAHDYAAVKFDYLPSVLELAVDAHALGIPLLGCDMPHAMRPALGPESMGEELRVRELHCLFALQDALVGAPRPRRIAMLWGQDHVGAAAFRRYFAPGDEVVSVYVFGDRSRLITGPTLESSLGTGLAVLDPTLVVLDAAAERAVLLLPDAVLGGAIDRVTTNRPLGAAALHVEVRAEAAGTLLFDGVATPVPRDAVVSIPAAAGDHACRFTPTDPALASLVFAIEIPPAGGGELELDPAHRSARVVSIAP